MIATASYFEADGRSAGSEVFTGAVTVDFSGAPGQERWVQLGVVTLAAGPADRDAARGAGEAVTSEEPGDDAPPRDGVPLGAAGTEGPERSGGGDEVAGDDTPGTTAGEAGGGSAGGGVLIVAIALVTTGVAVAAAVAIALLVRRSSLRRISELTDPEEAGAALNREDAVDLFPISGHDRPLVADHAYVPPLSANVFAPADWGEDEWDATPSRGQRLEPARLGRTRLWHPSGGSVTESGLLDAGDYLLAPPDAATGLTAVFDRSGGRIGWVATADVP